MQECKPSNTPVAKGDKFNLSQYPRNDFGVKEMQKIPYASIVESLMYAQVCTCSDILYIVGMQPEHGSLESSQKDHEVLAKNKVLFTHI